MLKLNLDNLFSLRGVNKKMAFLYKNGFSKTIAHQLSNNKFKRITLANIEKLCLTFDCTPNDIFTYIPDEKTPKKENLALNKLIHQPIPSIHDALENLSIEEAKEIMQKIPSLKNQK